MQKSVKNDEPLSLALLKTSNDSVARGRGSSERKKESPSYAAIKFSHGMTEGQKRKINRESGPKRDIMPVKGQEREVLDSVPAVHRKSLKKLIKECRDVFPGKLSKGAPPN